MGLLGYGGNEWFRGRSSYRRRPVSERHLEDS
jgi:hypothetical protein